MSPLITPEVNTLIMVLPRGKPPNPPAACWGLVLEKSESGMTYKVRIGKDPYDITYVMPDQIIPFLHTDGSFNDPQRVFSKNEEKIVLHLMLNFLRQQGVVSDARTAPAELPEPISVVPIQENTLVIILPKEKNPPEACWGLVCQRLTGGNYEVQIGRFRYLSISRIVVQPDQLIPVYLTDGSFKSPRHAVRSLRSQLFLHLLLVFYSAEGSNFLRQISQPLSKSDFVLISRKSKSPPLPSKKPE
ncbi:hypothetical protein KKE19_02955 [Patescibacteria group bacterium]|nr:hypothetical protein [Patescibacteria group bacterium]MBU4274750.1 hypothetical protein [Patescibacteria group bacterium]MBU4368065.1 hypothetical protein [Patescibacteria group bacterium]MBU4462294.1 hypothetical protein [Patescibacteria group bacterium]MCG2700343.1 hypothetical protein [Candidatus Parcubacteria bacterium]